MEELEVGAGDPLQQVDEETKEEFESFEEEFYDAEAETPQVPHLTSLF